MFQYAFKRLGHTEPGEEVIYLTNREFDVFFSASPPSTAQKALAYSEFVVNGEQLKRLAFDRQTQQLKDPL